MKLGTAHIFDEINGEVYAEVELSSGPYSFTRAFEVPFSLYSAEAAAPLSLKHANAGLHALTPSLIRRAKQHDEPQVSRMEASSLSSGALQENILPSSSCAAAAQGNKRMVLFVQDSGAQDTVQFTDIAFMYFDGVQWSPAEPISTDSRAEFAPQLAFTDDGDVIAVWERFASAEFNEMDWSLAAAQREIVWAKWDHENRLWTTPATLTNNNHMDHSPRLVGPLPNGSLVLTWIENIGNEYAGTPASPNSIRSSRFNPGTFTWSSPTAIVSGIKRQGSQDLVAGAGKVLLVWTEDMDGFPGTQEDVDTRYALFDQETWTVGVIAEEEPSGDATARAVIRSNGEVFVFASGAGTTRMRMSRGLDGVFQRIDPPDYEDPDFPLPDVVDFQANSTRRIRHDAPQHDFNVLPKDDGRILMTWPDKRDDSKSAVLKATFDPDKEVNEWTNIGILTSTSGLIKGLVPLWKDSVSLEIYCVVAEMETGPRTLVLEDGRTVEVDSLPSQGQVNLVKLMGAHGPNYSVKLFDQGFPVQHSYSYLSAEIRNSGDVASPETKVSFYLNDPANGGVLIGTADVGSLEPGDADYPYLGSS